MLINSCCLIKGLGSPSRSGHGSGGVGGGRSGPSSVPSFRFSKADQAMVEILEGADSMISSVADQAESQLQNVSVFNQPTFNVNQQQQQQQLQQQLQQQQSQITEMPYSLPGLEMPQWLFSVVVSFSSSSKSSSTSFLVSICSHLLHKPPFDFVNLFQFISTKAIFYPGYHNYVG